MRPLAIAIAMLAAALGGCGDDASPVASPTTSAPPAPSTTTTAETTTKKKPTKPPRFTGQDAINYANAFDVCSVFTVKQVAKEYGTTRDAVSAAEGYAAGYRPAFRQAVFEGCLDAFLGESAQVK
jgi:hypothetical protein